MRLSRNMLAALAITLCLVGPLFGQSKKLTHSAAVRALAFSADGKLLAAACQGDANVHIWDVAAAKELRTLAGPPGGPLFLAFAPEGYTLAGGGRDNDIFLWDANAGKETGRLKGHEKEVSCAAFTPDGKSLISGGFDNTVRVWDLATKKEVHQFPEPNAVNSLAVSHDGKLVAVVGWFKEVRVYDLANKQLARQCLGHQDSCVSVAFSPDGRLIASGSMEQAIRIWEAHSGEEVRKIDDPRKQANTLAFSPDGRLLLAAFEDRSVRLLDLALIWDPARQSELERNEEHVGPALAAIFSPDGKTIASGATDGKALLRDVSGIYRNLYQGGDALPARKLERFWVGLASRNPRQAYPAVWGLGMAPKQAMPLFLEKLTPIALLMNKDHVAKLITELDDDKFPVREKAAQDLEKMGSLIDPILRKALTGVLPSLEVRRRIERILEKIKAEQGGGPSPDVLRASRALVVLERFGTPEAKQLLEKFAGGMPEAQLTQDAKAALERLGKRGATP
jgi:WD40 repeat protein